MALDRADCHNQLLGYLVVGISNGNEMQDFHSTGLVKVQITWSEAL